MFSGGHGGHGCYGGYGGYNGGGYYGCYGCYGCGGGGYYGSGWGGYGCYGGGYGGCYGGGYGCAGYGCYGGCYGGGYGGCYGSPYSPVGPVGPGVPVVPGDKVPVEKLPNPKGPGDQTSRAKVVIDVPAQAKLYIDDQLMPDKAGKRVFVTPVLQAGQTYYYDVKLVVIRDGQEQAETTRVLLRSGDVVSASFPALQNNNGIATVQFKRD
jgi:uncharacterized protein (TIGR03000 family)